MKVQINSEIAHNNLEANDICYSVKGRSIITVGNDHKIRIKNLKNENETKILTNHINNVTAIDIHDRIFVTGSEDGTAMLFEYPSGICRKLLTRFSLPITSVCFSPDGKRVAVASNELKVRIIDILDISNSIVTIENIDNTIKSIQFDPSGKFIILVSSEGSLKIFDISNTEPKLIKENKTDILISKNKNEKCNISWNSNKKHFAIPGNNNDISVFNGKDWSLLYKFENKNIKMNICNISWSINSWYLASIDTDSNILIWRTQDRKLLLKYHHERKLIKVIWSPKDNDIAFIDELGYLNIWSNVKEILDGLNNSMAFPINVTKDMDMNINKSVEEENESQDNLLNLFEDIEAEEDMNVKDIQENTNENGYLKKQSRKENDIEKKSNRLDSISLSDKDDSEFESEDEVDDFVEDDDGAGYAERGYDAPIKTYRKRNRHRSVRFENDMDFEEKYQAIECQSSFQPGSTPLLNSNSSNSNKRYLAFNMLGSISSVKHDDEISTIHVEYHDRSVLRPYSFTDHRNYTMGSLGERGALFACESNKELSLQSTLYFKPIETWATKSDWQLELNNDENIKVITLTSKGIVAATDKKYIRFFSYSGFQQQIFSIKGKIVSMAGNSSNSHLIIVYHNGGVYNGDQNLEYILYDTETFTVIRKDSLPISPNSTLEWIGFTEYGIPATYDSEGVGRILVSHVDYQWIPVIDTSYLNKPKEIENEIDQINDTTYWAVGMTEKHFLCVVLKGSEHYPHFQKPIVSELNLQVPFLQMETQDGILEERIYRTDLFIKIHREQEENKLKYIDNDVKNAKEDLELDKLILTLIMNSCKEGNVQRALDLTTSLRLLASIEKSVLIAVRYHLSSLAERMQLIKEAKFVKQREQEQSNKRLKRKYQNPDENVIVYRTEDNERMASSPELVEMNDDNNLEKKNDTKIDNIYGIKENKNNTEKSIIKEKTKKKVFNQHYRNSSNDESIKEITKNPFAIENTSPKQKHNSKTLLDAIEHVKTEHINKTKKRKALLNPMSSEENIVHHEKKMKTTFNSSIIGFFGGNQNKKQTKTQVKKINDTKSNENSEKTKNDGELITEKDLEVPNNEESLEENENKTNVENDTIENKEIEQMSEKSDNENNTENVNSNIINTKGKEKDPIKKPEITGKSSSHSLLEKFKFKSKN